MHIRFVLHLVIACAAPIALPAQVSDLLIRGGSVHDGAGAPPRVTDVAIHAGRIRLTGTLVARDTIDARGLIVAPGFIDPHVHAAGDLSLGDSATRRAPYALMQGVTTIITGNDGGGTFSVGEALERYATLGIGPNVGVLVGHNAVRSAVVGNAARAASAPERDSMRALVAAAMREGALGFSTGLFYPPGSFATTDEVIDLARVAAAHGGIYDTHLRDESSYSIGLLASVEEALAVGRATGIPVHISHIKALGVDVWGSAPAVIAMVRAAQEAGLAITANQYPWTASGTGLHSALLPRWAQAGGRDSLLARLAAPAVRAQIATEMQENLRRRGGAGSLLLHSISGADALRIAHGQTLEAYARSIDVDPVEAAIGIFEQGRASVASFNMREDDIEAFMREPWVMTGSDGSAGHPRKYATYPRKLRRYVLDHPVLEMSRMIEASSGQVARTFGLAERGELREGWHADVIVFDPARIRERATYTAPDLLAEGMRWVFVNGVAVVAEGATTAALPGQALRRHDPSR